MKSLLSSFCLLALFSSINYVTAQTAVYTDNSPSENFINEEFCYTDFITNSGAPGYGPYIRIEVPPNATLGGVSFQGGSATTTFVGTFAGGLLGDPMLTSGTVADSVAGTVGNDLFIVEFPVGSMVAGGPNFEIEICWTITSGATVGVAESINITPVYTYGDTPTGDNGPIIGATVTETVIPIAYLFTKQSDNFEEEATPGSCTPVLFTLDLDVANAFTVNDINITDLLPAGLQYVTLVSNGGCAVVSEPSTVTPGGTLNLDCGSVTGLLGSGDRTIIYEAFYPDILDETNCASIDVFNAATATPSSEPAQTDADTSTVQHAIIVHGNNAGGPVSIGQTVTYSINTEITEFSAGLTAYSLQFIVPDGMIFTPGSIQLGGTPVAAGNILVVAGPGTGSTVTVDIAGEIGGTVVPCSAPVLTYNADVSQTYASGDPVLSRDPLNNTSTMTYSLTEGAAGCTNSSASSIEVVDISINKIISNSPPVGPGRNGEWIPGDVIQYRLEMNIPSLDLDDVVITDFFPLPIHDVTTLAPAFGTDVTFDPASAWMNPPVGYTLDAATNSLTLDFGDVSDGGTGTSVDIIILVDIIIEAVPYANGLFHSNFMGAETDNTGGDGIVSSTGTLFVVGTPELTIDKSVVNSDNASASISSGNISGVDASDTVFFALTATNIGGAQAYDVTFTDAVPAGFNNCELAATDPVTLSGMTPMTFTGGFTGNNLAITLTDSIPFGGNPGGDAAVVNFFCLVDNTNEPQFVLTNEVTTNWTSSPGGLAFPNITDDATVEIASLDVNKSIDTIFPTNTNGSDVRIGDNITYTVVVDIPEGGMTNLNFHDQLSNGLAFVSIDDIVASAGLTSSLGGFAALIGTEVYSNPGVNPEQEDQIMDLALGDITNTDTDNTVTETITITYTTSVLNSSANNRGDNLRNRFDAIWDNPNGGGTVFERDRAPNVTIAEPELAITKSFLNNQLIPGDETFVTLNVGHIPASDATAYDVSFNDTLPLGLNYVPGSNSLTGSFSATPVVTVAGNIITVDIDSLSTSQDISLTFVVEVDDAFPSCDTIENCSYVTWESLLDLSQVGLPVGINNAFVGERTGNVGDVGGTNNTHSTISCASIFTTNGLNTDPNISSTGTICEGGSVTLSVQAYTGSMVSYEWTGPGIPPAGVNSNVVTFNPVSFADTGDYTLVVNVDGCVSDTSQIFSLQIFENPSVAPTNNGTLCMTAGTDLILTSNVTGGTAPYTYAWTGPNGFTSQAQDPIIPNPTSANSGMYFVSVTDVNGCSNPVSSTTVNVSETPTQPNLVSNAPLCEGEDLTITAPNYTGNTVVYNWTGPNGAITLNSNILNLSSVSASDAGNYSLEVVVDGCSSQIATLAVQINAPPAAINPISNSPLCENDTLFLMANNTTGSTYSYDWTGPNGFSSNNENPELYGVTSASNGGFYTLVVTDSNGCSTQGSLQVTIFDKPETPTVSVSDAQICVGESTSISSNTAYTGTVLFYIWTGPNGIDTTFVPTLNINPATLADSGLYMLDVEVDGCTSNTSSSVLISVNENTQVPVITSNSPVCEGDDIVLTTPTSATTYNWTGPNGFTSNLQSPPAITASNLTAGTYNLSTIENGCESVVTTATIVVNATPSVPTITGPSAICEGDDLVLSTNATCDSYAWIAPSGADPANPLLNTVANTTTIPSSDAAYAAGDWSVICISSDGCESAPSTPINVTVNAVPTAVAFNDGPICSGGDATLTGNTLAGSTQTWFDELFTTTLATTSVHTETNLATGTYTFNYVLNVNGCVDTASTIVTVDAQLAAPTVAVSSNSVCEGEDFILSTSTVADGYAWSGPNGYSSSSQNPPAITGSAATAGTYSLVVTQNGCVSAPGSQTVVVNARPNAPAITGPSAICDGDDLVLSTNGTCDSYTWIAPSGADPANPLLNTVANTTTIPSSDAAYSAGDWSVICISSDGCESAPSTPINVTINAVPTAVAFNDGPICSGGDATLTGNTLAGSTQTWFDELFTTTLATTSVHTETNLATGTYTFNYVLNVNGCVDTASTIVTVDAQLAAPTVAVSSNSVCEGEDFILSTSTVADGYAWSGPNGYSSSSQNPPAITGSAATAGIYSLVVTQNGCTSAPGSQTVVVNATPTAPTVSGPTSICDGDDLLLSTSSTCDSYLWIGPGGSSAGTLSNPLLNTAANTTTIPSSDAAYAGGDWSVVCVSPDGCESPQSAPINITINPVPTAVAFNDGPICENGDVTLTGNTTAGSTQTWFDELYTTTLATTPIHTETNLAAGTYTFNYVLNVNGCVDTASTIVTVSTVLAAPAIASTSTSVCEGESFALSTTTSADSYSWTGPNGFTSSAQNPLAITATPFTAGTYSLTVVINGCGSSTATIDITVNAVPSAPTISGPLSICDGDDLVLSTSSTCDSYLWIGPGGSSAGTLANPLLNTAANTTTIPSADAAYAGGNWSVICVSPDGCESPESAPINVNIQPLPVASATNNGPICDGGDVTLTGNNESGATQTWFDELYTATLATTPIHTEPNLAAGTYTFNYVLNVNGCVDTASTVVTVDPPLAAPVVAVSSNSVCEGEEFILSTSTVADSYLWSGPNGYSSMSQAPPAIIGSTATAGTYSLVVTQNGCTSAAGSQTVVVNAVPSAPTITGPSAICDGDDIVLATNSSCDSYIWIAPSGADPSNALLNTAANTTTIPSTDAAYAGGDWSVICVSPDGCESPASAPINVTINAVPTAVAFNDGPICDGGDVTLTGNTVSNGSYQWFDETYTNQLASSETHQVTNLASGTYTFNYIVNTNGCVDTASTVVTVSTVLAAPTIASTSTSVCEGESFALSTTTSADSYSWTGPNGFTSSAQNPIAITGTSFTAGTYSLTVVINGCGSSTATIDITVNAVPSAPTITGPSAICDGDDIVLATNSSCDSYIWVAPSGVDPSNALLNTAANTTTIPSTDAAYAGGDWSVICVSPDGCESPASAPINVTINAVPTAVAFNDGPICDDGDVTLTGNTVSNGSYQWFDETYTNQLSSSETHQVTNLAAGTYTFNYIVNVNSCVDTASTVVTVDPPVAAPVVAVSSNSVCEGEAFVLSTSTVADSYSWTGPNGYVSMSQAPPAIVGSSVTAGTYSLIVTQGGCTSLAGSQTVVVNAVPSAPTISGPLSICDGDDLVLSTSSTCDSYLWIGPGGSSAGTLANPLLNTTANTTTIPSADAAYAGGNWSVICVSPDGCESPESAPINVNIQPLPVASATNNGPICDGGDVTLTGNNESGATQTWFDELYTTTLATTPIHTEPNLAAGIYTFNYVLNVNGCVDTASTVVTVDPPLAAPVVAVSSNSVCEGEEFILSTSTAADSYLWSGPNGYSSMSQAPPAIIGSTATAGTYSLVVTQNACTSAAGSQTVVVNAVPSAPTIAGPTSICEGDDLVLSTSSTCDSYLWIGPGGSSAGTLSNPLLNTTANNTTIPFGDVAYAGGDWSVICVSPDGCESPESTPINVTIIPVPTNAVAASNSPVCEGDDILLTTNGVAGATYVWSGTNGFTSVDQNPIITNAQSTDAADYSVTISFMGCSSTTSTATTVVVNPIPPAPVPLSNSPVCEGDTIFLFSNTTATNYSWTGPNGFTATTDTAFISNSNLTYNGFYNLTTVVGGCLSPAGQVQVDVVPSSFIPTISSVDDELCVGDILELNTTGFSGTSAQYIWYGPSGTLDTTFNPTYIDTSVVVADSGEYFVQVLIGSCLSLPSQIELIDVNTVPIAPDIGYTAIVCEEDFIQLTTTTVADSYQWTGPNGYSSTLQNPAVISPASVINTGNYSLSVTVDGCSSEDSVVTITVNPKPGTPTIFGDSPICVGDSLVVYTASFADNYQWTAPNGTITLSPSDSLVVYPVLPADAGTYTLELEVNGCLSDPISITISIDDSTNAVAYAGEDFILCNEANLVNLSAVDNGTGFWTTNSNATIISSNDPETLVTDLMVDSTYIFYWTLVSGSCGGTTMDSISIYVPPSPIANTDNATLTAGQSIVIDVMNNDSTFIAGGISIMVDPSQGLASIFANEIEYTADEGAGTSDEFIYELCYDVCPEMCDTAFVNITIDPLLNIPDIITPNGDGSNDAFVIEGIQNYPSHELKIFNRWGNEIFFSDNYQNDWIGIYNNEELPDGTYYYVFTNTEDGELLMNGYITLHR